MSAIKLPSNWSEKIIAIKCHPDYSSNYDYEFYGNDTGYIGDFSYAISKYRDMWKHVGMIECREDFQEESFKKNRILFNCRNIRNAHNVAKLIHQVEDILNLKKRSIVGVTNQSEVMWIEASKWWTHRYQLRRSFFTAMLRAGLEYSPKRKCKDNLFQCHYLGDVPYATERFLEGYTKEVIDPQVTWANSRDGWYSVFFNGDWSPSGKVYPISNENVDKILVKA